MNCSYDEIAYYFHDRVGWLKLTTTNKGVSDIAFVFDAPRRPRLRFSRIMGKLIDELNIYFSGQSMNFLTPVDITMGSLFCRSVWQALQNIPYGHTISYGGLAFAIGNPKAARAVGMAMARNPVPIIIPCHRVIRSDGSLGGYGPGIEFKRSLLELENAPSIKRKITSTNKQKPLFRRAKR